MRLKHLVLGATLFGASLVASESVEHNAEHHKELTPYYVAVKGMYTLGDDYTNDYGIKEEGDAGYGVAVDFGYYFYKNFAVELDFTYENGDVTAYEEEEGELRAISETAEYYTSSLDLVYMFKPIHELGILFKVGYEYEYETIADESNDETGFVFAAGLEYHLSHHYRAIAEYEHSTIDGPKGDAIFAGIVYNF